MTTTDSPRSRTAALPLRATAVAASLLAVACSSDDDSTSLPLEVFTSSIDSAQELPAPVAGTGVTVSIRNAAPQGGTFQTPVWVGFHDGSFDIYDQGSAAGALLGSMAVERLAEDGTVGPITGEFDASPAGAVQGTLAGVLGPAPGPIAPAETVQAHFRLDPTAMTSRYFSYASMVIPSNDAFVANGNPMAHEVFDGTGTFVATGFTVAGGEVLDAGTEVNDELPANTAFFGQAAPNTGDDENGTVQLHPGFLATGGILDDAMFANADFTAAGYEALRVDFQETTGLTLGTGVATYTLNPNNRSLRVEASIAGLSGPATMLHLHQGAAGATGPVLVDLFGLVTENAGGTLTVDGSVTLTAAQVDLLRAGEVYLNCHTALNPAGELRGQVDAGAGFTATLDTVQELPTPVLGTNVRVTVRNGAPANGTLQTPVWFGFHDGSFDIYDIGLPAANFFPVTNGLERLAEDGTLADFNQTFDASGAGDLQGSFSGPGGPLAPGELVSQVFRLDPASASSAYFSYASMVIPSNDAFVANGNPTAHPVFDGVGALVAADFTVGGDEVLDAGTETNDEIPMNTAAFGQTMPDTGVTTMDNVALHPGLMPAGSGGILDDANFAAADFTAVGYETLDVSFAAGPAAVPATGSALVTLNQARDQISFSVVASNLSGPATMLHLHMGAAGQTGAVELDIFGSVTRNEGGALIASGTAAVTPAQVALLEAGELYFNLHTELNPAGEIRGQVLPIMQ